MLVLLAVAVVVLGLNVNAPAYATGTTAEGGTFAPATPAPTFTAIAGTNGYENLYDGNVGTKLCVAITQNPSITFQANDLSTVVTAYKLYTGDDTQPEHAGRNPKSWTLEGSNDNSNWVDIHTVTNDDKLPELNNQTGYNYTIENITPYWYYRLTFTERHGATGASANAENDYNLMQISEIEFTSTADVTEIDTEEDLVTAFANGGSYKLVADVALSADLSLRNKMLSLDLNGYVISSDKNITIYACAPDVNTTFILKDSRPTATHTNASLPAGGVIDCALLIDRQSADETYDNKAYFYASGGTAAKRFTLNTAYAIVDYFGDNMTTFTGGMTTATNPVIYGGFYYGEVASTKEDKPVQIKNKKVLFKNGDTVYATQIVKSGDKAMTPANPTTAPEKGLTFVDWYSDTFKYNFSSTITSDITVYAMWLKEVATANDFKSAIDSNYSVKLTADIVLDTTFVINDGKASTIDLNGHVISFANQSYEILIKTLGNTRITLIDSNPTATHENIGYPVGGYITKLNVNKDSNDKYSHAYIVANGGTIGSVGSNTSYAHLLSTSPTPTIIKNVTSNYIDLQAGTYYYNESKISSSAKTITFMNGDNLYAKVATGSKIVAAPAIEPTKEGYTFVGWYNGNTEHDFTQELTSSVTLTAKWIDSAAPVITGVDADNVYCTGQEVTITDDSAVTVTVDGTEVTLTSGKFNLDMSSGFDKTIVATDAANNVTTLVVAYGHHLGDWIEKVDEDCSNNGTLGHKICVNCHDNFDENGVKLESLVIPACHVYGTVGYSWAADNSTCTATRVCSHDANHVETETVNATSSVTQQQSCTNDELTTYVATFTTNTAFIQQSKTDVITSAKHGHDFDTVSYSWTSDNLKCTATRVCSYDDSHVETETVISGSSVTQMQSCINAELTTYVATFTNSVFAQQTKANVQTKAAAGHNLSALANEVAATCTENGLKAHADCSVCNKHFDATGNEITDLVIPALGHSYGEWVDEVGATTSESGLKGHKDCDACHKHFDETNAEISDVDLVIAQLPETPAEEGLSGGAIAGIVIGCLVLAGIVAFAIVWFVVKKKTFADIAAIFRK